MMTIPEPPEPPNALSGDGLPPAPPPPPPPPRFCDPGVPAPETGPIYPDPPQTPFGG